MQFIIDFDVISLIFLGIIGYHFLNSKVFPMLSNYVFGWLLILGIVNLVLDIAGSLALINLDSNTLWIPYVINMLYYIVQLVFPAALIIFMASLKYNHSEVSLARIVLCLMPALACLLVFFVGMPVGLVFQISVENGYTYGPLSSITYICVAVYLLITIIMMILNREFYSRQEKRSFIILLGFIVAAATLQYFFPRYLLVGSALAAGFTIMYFTIWNSQNLMDPDTGIYNTDALDLNLNMDYNRCMEFCMVMLTIHNLRNYYMVYGRDAGKTVLEDFSRFLWDFDECRAFRYSDTQFVVLLKENKNLDHFMQALAHKKEEPIMAGDTILHPFITTICIRNAHSLGSARALLQVTEKAMSESMLQKYAGTTTFLNHEQLTELEHMVILEHRIRESLKTGKGFRMFYQPIYSFEKDRFCCAEALLRYQEKEFGRVMPDEFIPIIEEKGLASEMDEMVVEKVYNHIAEGRFRGLRLTCCHINLSAMSFSSKYTLERIIDLTKRYDIDPRQIVFEVTETMPSLSPKVALANARRLREAGFGLSLDDFGTGYANITQVLELPFSVIKLDRSIIQNSIKIVPDLVNIFRNYDVTIIGEGVETQEQCEVLKNIGVEHVQGYLYARPMPVDETVEFLLEQKKQN